MMPPVGIARVMSGTSTTAMQAMGMLNAALRLRYCASTRLNSRPGSCGG